MMADLISYMPVLSIVSDTKRAIDKYMLSQRMSEFQNKNWNQAHVNENLTFLLFTILDEE